MIIKLHDLRKGPNEIVIAGVPEELELPVKVFARPVEVKLILEEIGGLIKADFLLKTVTRQICDRCAADFEMPLEVKHLMYFIPEGEGSLSGQDEVKYFHPDRPQVNIGGDVHDDLMLAIPQKILCSEDCRGLCPQCGADLNLEECSCAREKIDPRWEKLAKLREQLKTD